MEITAKNIALFIALLYLVELSEQQTDLHLKTWIQSYINNARPVVNVECRGTFPVGSLDHTVIWILRGGQLAVNEKLKVNIPDRYSVNYVQDRGNTRKYISQLSIRNAIKSDEGFYNCHAKYNQGTDAYTDIDTIFVPILKYLPELNYPHCSTSSQTLHDGDNATFSCLPGDSNPPVNLRLVLEGPHATLRYVRDSSSITTMITVKDNNSYFVCHMTSNTFPNGMRSCSLGPIIVSSTPILILPTELSSTGQYSDNPTNYETTNVYKSDITTTESASKGSGSNSPIKQPFTPIIIGSAAGGILIVLLLIVIICLVLRRYKSKDKKPVIRSDNPQDNMYSSQMGATNSANLPISVNQASNHSSSMPVYGVVNKTNTAGPKLPNSAGQQSNQDNRIPVYAVVNNTNDTSSPNSAANHSHGGYEDTTLSSISEASNFPIYSQVNKDSGTVDNIIYVSAGPK